MYPQVAYFISSNARSLPDKNAIICEDTCFTWMQLNTQANILASAMEKAGIKKGDVVSYLMKNISENIIIWWATQKIGAIAMPMNTFLLPNELVANMNHVQCKLFFYQDEDIFREKAEQIITNVESLILSVRCKSTEKHVNCQIGSMTFEDFVATGEEDYTDVPLDESDGSLLLFTSGSTGVPKAVMRTQRAVRDYAIMLSIGNKNKSQSSHEVFLTISPMFHTAAFSMMTMAALLGSTLILLHDFREAYILEQIEKYGVTQLLFVPPILYTRLQLASCREKQFTSVKVAWGTGGTVSSNEIEAMHSLFPNAKWRFSWGSTEICAPTSAVLAYEDLMSNPTLIGNVGKQNVLCEIKLVGDDGEIVSNGEVGEALIRSSMVFKEYYKQPKLSEGLFDYEGFFKTGDLLRSDKEGFYFFSGRKVDMVKTGGENVYAQEVEQVVREYPPIKDCAMIGVPDARFGEAVAIVVELQDCKKFDVEEFKKYCNENLPSFKKPRYIRHIDKMPRNSVGKLQKKELRTLPSDSFVSIY
jgi:long-chain acyl-CoA synthetase